MKIIRWPSAGASEVLSLQLFKVLPIESDACCYVIGKNLWRISTKNFRFIFREKKNQSFFIIFDQKRECPFFYLFLFWTRIDIISRFLQYIYWSFNKFYELIKLELFEILLHMIESICCASSSVCIWRRVV